MVKANDNDILYKALELYCDHCSQLSLRDDYSEKVREELSERADRAGVLAKEYYVKTL